MPKEQHFVLLYNSRMSLGAHEKTWLKDNHYIKGWYDVMTWYVYDILLKLYSFPSLVRKIDYIFKILKIIPYLIIETIEEKL